MWSLRLLPLTPRATREGGTSMGVLPITRSTGGEMTRNDKLGRMATSINMAASALPSRGLHGGEKSIWLHHPYLLRVPMVGRN